MAELGVGGECFVKWIYIEDCNGGTEEEELLRLEAGFDIYIISKKNPRVIKRIHQEKPKDQYN